MEYKIGKYVAVQEDADGNVYVTRPSILSNRIQTVHIQGATAAGIAEWMAARMNGLAYPMVQDAFPDMSVDDREFLLTGITAEEWDANMVDA